MKQKIKLILKTTLLTSLSFTFVFSLLCSNIQACIFGIVGYCVSALLFLYLDSKEQK